jgi:A/G-specific adenine glycosylase
MHDEARLELQHALLDWYAENKRDLPWRQPSADPYAVWVSEVMLQQTQVETVKPYYRAWLRAFPDLATLARASETEVLQRWQGLGYYSRARRLHAGAKHVVRAGGRFPHTASELAKLPGVGPYTAGAIASIAFGLDEPVVDGNVIRVLTRLFALGGDPQRAPLRRTLWRTARSLLPTSHAGDFNQALMELGAIRCTPQRPLCNECPVRRFCLAAARGNPTDYPQLAKRPAVTLLHHVSVIAERRGRVLLAQTPADSRRWPDMWVFPTIEVAAQERPDSAARRALCVHTGLSADDFRRVHELTHSVTRYRIKLEAYVCLGLRGRAIATDRCQAIRWVPRAELPAMPMPAPQRKIALRLCSRLPTSPER